jgi:hypothetical protein
MLKVVWQIPQQFIILANGMVFGCSYYYGGDHLLFIEFVGAIGVQAIRLQPHL